MTGLVERLRSWHHLTQGDSLEALIITGMEAADRITALEAQVAAAEQVAQAYDDAGDRAIATGIRIALAAYRAAKGE